MACTSGSQSPSSSSFSSNPQLIKGRYDIFLSFRGLDTRKKFTDHLYHALMREGFQTFRDDDEIDKGEDIKFEMRKAIRNSWMSVIVLSENYANSMSCLFELQTILELCKKSDHFVLPVFYEVEPEVLKEQSKNLVFERKEATVERVKGWNAALKEGPDLAIGSSSPSSKQLYEEIENRITTAVKLRRIPENISLKHKGLSQWNSSSYEEMENRITTAVKLGRIPENISLKHKGLSQWNSSSTGVDHDTILQKKKKEKEKKKKKKKKKKKFKQLLKKQKNDVLK
ncbi:hypothetical protein RHMOL_Rhmol11G0211100 [Rhododendron molle]|uniref:Uncharacterized protein n=2 Tax=Rhododendron molle TaxID=49168 RepID=A0ACC0LVJ0_RHOML|nr:hypothetical protein RHMOL_Rhmol11G0211100 [Rhododendron molle]KAI8532386.1 hypothetical protein RHMOL_Rhmol11G0211100 [Rhododendron molle]